MQCFSSRNFGGAVRERWWSMNSYQVQFMLRMLGIFLCITLLGMVQSCDSKGDIQEEGMTLYLSALDAYSQQDFLRTVELCMAAVAQDTDLIQARLLEAKARFFLDEVTAAENILSKLVARHPEFTDARLWLMRLLILQGQRERAADLVRRELELNETDWRVHYLGGLLHSQNQDYSSQLSSLQQAQRALADGAKVYLDLTRLWLLMGMKEYAQQQLDRARLLAPAQGEMQVLVDTMETLVRNQEEVDER